jgi:hypothetical protein
LNSSSDKTNDKRLTAAMEKAYSVNEVFTREMLCWIWKNY